MIKEDLVEYKTSLLAVKEMRSKQRTKIIIYNGNYKNTKANENREVRRKHKK